jgi:Uncharacterized conserved protein
MTIVWFVIAAILEIAGCFALWQWLHEGRSPIALTSWLPSSLPP